MGDVVLLDEKKDVGATNRRHLAALVCGATSGFEVQFKSPGVHSWSHVFFNIVMMKFYAQVVL